MMGVDLRTVQAAMGHRSIQMTCRYAHLAPDHELSAVEKLCETAATASLGTATGASCPAGTACASYTLLVPASTPSVGAFNSGGNQTPAAPVVGPSNYTIDAQSFLVGAGSQTTCSPSDLQTNQTIGGAPLLGTSGLNLTAATLSFTGCN